MTTPKPGDTVDPRTLPAGAKYRLNRNGNTFVVLPDRGWLCEENGAEGVCYLEQATLVSLPQPIADEVVELGTLEVGDRCVFHESERDHIDREFFESTCEVVPADSLKVPQRRLLALLNGRTAHFWNTRKVRRVPAPTQQPECACRFDSGFNHTCDACKAKGKRPHCDACGDESACDHDLLGVGTVRLCDGHYFDGSYDEIVRLICARRANQTATCQSCREPLRTGRACRCGHSYGPGEPDGGQSVASSLPTYDQIAGWLGAEWVITLWGSGLAWCEITGLGLFRCYLKHAPTGHRVEVTAPHGAMAADLWACWFGRIRRFVREGMGQFYHAQVRWLDPDTKTSGSGDATTRKDAGASQEQAPGRSPQPEASRWSTTDPARIAALEGKLADQVAHGGQGCKSARWLLERADTLRREEEARSRYPLAASDATGRKEAWGVDPFVQPGRSMSRFELPADQRLDRKRTGR